ncbi:MAG: circularly permuted type 2 ATP-grasp protein [Agriterribacter sp.]
MTANTPETFSIEHLLNHNYTYAESVGSDANLQPLWNTFFNSLSRFTSSEIEVRKQDIFRMLRENGVTYNIYGDPSGLNRPWNLDIIPYLIDKQEWSTIESGLVQRAELLNLILRDIYGERRLIKQGILPAELVYNHNGFLRQCAGIKQLHQHSLILYSADLARSQDGSVWVLNDRTQAPSGSGYALENRITMARVLPELFNGLQVRHLSSYFETLRHSLREIAPVKNGDTRIVIFTPGSSNETYFEHSYLSTYLGFSLVQGDDLMVRDNYVWLKTLGGLEKVDVILRRVDDSFCDPLELKDDSILGVPGLVQAVRSGNVTIANPLGSGVLENPGLMPFLQSMSRYFLNQDLILPGIASWWCGQPKEMQYVLDNIQSLVIKKIFKQSRISTSVDGASLSEKEIEKLKQSIKAYPCLYVGQEKISISPAPSLINGKIEPRTALFRTYLTSNAYSYTAMSGGLTRTSPNNNFLISNQLGSISKDTWIIAPEDENKPVVPKDHILVSAYKKGDITSRTAENLFWVGRYAERVLGTARFLRTVMQFITEGNRHNQSNDIETERHLLEAITHYTATYPGFLEDAEKKFASPWRELNDVLFDEKRNGSLLYNFRLFCRVVYAERDHWSTDTWRVIWSMENVLKATYTSDTTHIRALNILDSIITSMVAFIGLNRESISREQGWIMLDMGRKIEQCMLLTSMLRSTMVNKYDEQVDYNLQEAVLKSNETLVNYRYKYRVHIQHALVLELMLLDPNNPRSIIYQLDRLKAYLNNLPRLQDGFSLQPHEKLIFEAYSLLKLTDREQLTSLDETRGQYKLLDEFLEKLYQLLFDITGAVSKLYFKHAQKQKQLFTAESF